MLLLLFAFLVPVSPVFAEEYYVNKTEGPYTFYNGAAGAQIVSVDESAMKGDVRLPASLGGQPLMGIEDGVFSDCRELTSIHMPDRIFILGREVFKNCDALKSVRYPRDTDVIPPDFFAGCSSLEEVTNIQNVSMVYDNAFKDCISLSSITFGETFLTLKPGAFNGCTSLAEINVSPKNLLRVSQDGILYSRIEGILLAVPPAKELGDYVLPETTCKIDERAFMGNKTLTSITLHSKVTEIGTGAFYDCSNLKKIVLSEGRTSVGSGLLASESVTELVLPQSLTSLNAGCFSLSSLERIELPAQLKEVDEAFAACPALREISVHPDNPFLTVKDGVLYSAGEERLIFYPPAREAEEFTVPDTVKELARDAFINCTELKAVYIPKSVRKIYCSFSGCSSLTDIYFEANETECMELFQANGGSECFSKAQKHYGAETIANTDPGFGENEWRLDVGILASVVVLTAAAVAAVIVFAIKRKRGDRI